VGIYLPVPLQSLEEVVLATSSCSFQTKYHAKQGLWLFASGVESKKLFRASPCELISRKLLVDLSLHFFYQL
jgi:hypothetical protein